MIGRRIRMSRAAAGLSLRALEARIGRRVTAQAISKYERGAATPGSGVLIALADALGVSVDYLAGERELVLEAVEFRKKRRIGRREEARVEAEVLRMLERYLAVEELLGLPGAAWDAPKEAPWPVRRALDEAEHAARELRGHWGLGADPIPNLAELLEGHGVKFLSTDLPGVDGLAARARLEDGRTAPVIVVNEADWGERQRFTAAHELGHMVLDPAPKIDGEKAAHRFAGAFLMPAEKLRAEIGERRKSIGWGELFALKRLFGVSAQALTYRCKELDIFGPALFQRLFDEFARRGWRSPPYEEPYAMKGETPGRFERLCLRAVAEGAISDARGAELLGIPTRDLDCLVKRADGPGGDQARA